MSDLQAILGCFYLLAPFPSQILPHTQLLDLCFFQMNTQMVASGPTKKANRGLLPDFPCSRNHPGILSVSVSMSLCLAVSVFLTLCVCVCARTPCVER